MERVKVLIDKLVQQQQRNESADAMLITVQLLQNELALLQRKHTTSGTSKVAVVMPAGAGPVIKREPKPAHAPTHEEPVATPEIEEPKIEEPKIEEPKIEKPAPEPVLEAPRVAAQPEPQLETRPVAVVTEQPEHEAYLPPKPKIQEPAPAPAVEEKVQYVLSENPYDAIEETPTLAQYQPTKKEAKLQKEINELIGEQKETLNERLKENKKELAHILKDTPIKDLRKAIGVNDRFVFVNELFRGDETMYERSIKTINGFHILPEAEYWINRELKVKLGWDDYKDSVQHFYHLVRRRFS